MWLNNANTTKSSLRFYVWYTVQSMWYVALERGRPRKLSKVNEWAFCTEDRLCTYLLCTHGTRVFLWVFVISDSKRSWNENSKKYIQLATDSKLITNGIVAFLLCIVYIILALLHPMPTSLEGTQMKPVVELIWPPQWLYFTHCILSSNSILIVAFSSIWIPA